MRSTWNKQTPVDQERQAVNEILMDLDSFRRSAASNPKFKALPDGLILQQITEEEWTARATADNASDSPIAKNSVMSGYVVADTEQLVLQKVGTNVQYKVTED